ncbi:MAG TPA: DUF523 domain-containing protein [Candidatus Binataceae bacterium]|nr:DUF523 domain-containing protein [Candidatus Binataceae bacterium]
MSGRKSERGPIVVSACLLGRPCRFDGKDKFTPELAFLLEGRNVTAVCPEELGGLGTPRAACQLQNGDGTDVLEGNARVISVDGIDRTQAFLSGATAALEHALAAGAREAILKESSPSCGVTRVYRDGALQSGQGVFAALLSRHGIRVTEETRTKGPKKVNRVPPRKTR